MSHGSGRPPTGFVTGDREIPADHSRRKAATVKTHVGRILAEPGLRDRVQAVVTAYETGLVTARSPSAGERA